MLTNATASTSVQVLLPRRLHLLSTMLQTADKPMKLVQRLFKCDHNRKIRNASKKVEGWTVPVPLPTADEDIRRIEPGYQVL